MLLAVAKAVPIRLEAVSAVHLDWHIRTLLLEVQIQDVWVQHPTQDQRVDDFAFWFEARIHLLDRRDVVLNDVVTNENLSVLKDLQPLLRVPMQLRLGL